MITGELKSQIDRIWDAFWSGGIANPLEVMEQLTYLLFIKQLDELHTAQEKKANHLGRPMEGRIFPEGNNDKGVAYEEMRWSRFKHLEAKAMFEVVSDRVFSFIRNLQSEREDSTYARHMKDARFTIPTPALLSRVVDLLDQVPMEDRDTKGNVYEYMLGKIASAGQNGQFRTPLDGSKHENNNLPDIPARWKNREGEEGRGRTEQSFLVPKADIAAKGYELSLNRYREVVQEAISYDAPDKVLDELDTLETEIQQGLSRLRAMLREQEAVA